MVSAGCTIRHDQSGPPTDSGLVILTEENPPYNFRGADGEAAGQSTEIVYEIGRRLNQIIEIELLPWSEAYESAQHSPNVALFSTVRTPERDLLSHGSAPLESRDSSSMQERDQGSPLTELTLFTSSIP